MTAGEGGELSLAELRREFDEGFMHYNGRKAEPADYPSQILANLRLMEKLEIQVQAITKNLNAMGEHYKSHSEGSDQTTNATDIQHAHQMRDALDA